MKRRWLTLRKCLKNVLTGSTREERPWKSPRGRPSSKELTLWRQPDWSTRRPTRPTLNRRGHTTSPLSSVRWPCLPTYWGLRSITCRRVGVNWRTSAPLTRWLGASPNDIHIFWIILPTESWKIIGLKGIYSSKALQQMRWPDLLPLVWQRGPEWRNGGESSVNYTLSPWPCCAHCLDYLHHQCRGHTSPCPCLQTCICWWWWRSQGRRSLWGWWQWQQRWWVQVQRGLTPPINSMSVFMPGQAVLTKPFWQFEW